MVILGIVLFLTLVMLLISGIKIDRLEKKIKELEYNESLSSINKANYKAHYEDLIKKYQDTIARMSRHIDQREEYLNRIYDAIHDYLYREEDKEDEGSCSRRNAK